MQVIGRSNIRYKVEDAIDPLALPDEPIKPSDDLAQSIRRAIPDDGKEHLFVLALTTSGNGLTWEIVADGSVDSCPLYPRDVFAWALTAPSVRYVGVAHNHPSGNVEPSGADVTGTRNLADVGRALGLDLAWSLVVSHRTTDWRSILVTSKSGQVVPPPVPGGDDQNTPPPPPPIDGEDEPTDMEPGDDDPTDEPTDTDNPTDTDTDTVPPVGSEASAEDLAAALDRLLGRK